MREYATSLIVGAIGGIAVIIAFGATWTVVTVPVFEGQPTPTTEIALTGRSLVPLGAAAGWVVLASVGGIIATRRVGRRIIGGVMAIASGVAGTAAITAAATYGALALSAASGPGAPAAAVDGLRPWWALALVGALAGAVTGVLAAWRGPRWPALGRRYDRPVAARSPTRPDPAMGAGVGADVGPDAGPDVGPGSAAGAATLPAMESWDALDRGEDPTVGPEDSAPGGQPGPRPPG